MRLRNDVFTATATMKNYGSKFIAQWRTKYSRTSGHIARSPTGLAAPVSARVAERENCFVIALCLQRPTGGNLSKIYEQVDS